MIRVSIVEAKSRFSELIRCVERGEAVVITRRGRPVTQLVVSASNVPDRQRDQVYQAFEELRQLRSGVGMKGDLKVIAREEAA